jgi:hypothetical protein
MNIFTIQFELPIVITESDFKRWFISCNIPPDTIFLQEVINDDTTYKFITILSENYITYITNNYIRTFFDPEEELINSIVSVKYNETLIYQGI